MVKLYFKLILFASIATASCLQGMKNFSRNRSSFTKGMKNFLSNSSSFPKGLQKRYSTQSPSELPKEENPFSMQKIRKQIDNLFNIRKTFRLIGLEFNALGRRVGDLENHKGSYGQGVKKVNDIKRDAHKLVQKTEKFLEKNLGRPTKEFEEFKEQIKNLKWHKTRRKVK